MDDISARVIDDAHLVQKSATPDAVSSDTVAEGQPERHKYHPGSEVHASQVCACNENQSDRGEDKLEVNHRGLRKVLHDTGTGECRLLNDRLECQNWAWTTGEWKHVLAEADFVGPDDPTNQNGGEGVEGHEHGVDGPLLLDDAGVEDAQPGYGLKGNERGRCQLPSVVTLFEPCRRLQEGHCGRLLGRCHLGRGCGEQALNRESWGCVLRTGS